MQVFWRENVQIVLDTGLLDKNGSISNNGNGTLHPDHFLHSFGSELQFLRDRHPAHLRLVKLHGSVTWLIRKDRRLSAYLKIYIYK
jgi:hypothetical protein